MGTYQKILKKISKEKIMNNTFQEWCIEQHVAINHYYEEYLPYEFHLRLTHKIAKQFRKLWESLKTDIPFQIIEDCCFSHDVLEDVPSRVNYNSLLKRAREHCLNYAPHSVECEKYAKYITEVSRTVMNYGRGRNRDERMPDFVYDDIKSILGAIFIKLCDRIANVEYGLLTSSSMGKKYEKENIKFKEKLYTEELKPMFDYLEELFEKV